MKKDPPPDRRTLLWVVIFLSLAAAPHAAHLSPWISGMYTLLVGIRLLALSTPRMLPGRFLLLIITCGALLNAGAHYQLLFDRDAGVALLVSMLGLKLLESRERRDLFVCVFLGYFLVITQFLYNQSMALASYLGLIIIALTAILVELGQAGRSPSLLGPLRRSALLLSQATPFMLVLFVLFPRLSGPLWNLSLDRNAGITGLSDRLSPGSVSHLSQSRAVALRVTFDGPPPEPHQRYWRGPVFWTTDGADWSTPEATSPNTSGQDVRFSVSGAPIDYTVILEPTGQRWLFALDVPTTLPPASRILPDFEILSIAPVNQELRYRMRSYPEYETGALSAAARRQALQLPDNVTHRMAVLVKRWQTSSREPSAIVRLALHHFRANPFVYTLNPPALKDNPADEFLFDTRRGFCEHYATSFTLLMRLAGIPARVVTGYLGGEYNPHGDYYIIRQSDAHAWSEVWLGQRGWVRIDPTLAVAPERVERSIPVQEPEVGGAVRFALTDPGLLGNLLHQLRLAADATNMAWRRWILEYDDRRQEHLLSLLGLDFLHGYALGVSAVLAAALLVALIGGGLWANTRHRSDPVARLYRRFCQRLARHGLQRRASEGPRDFAERIKHQRPELATAVDRITRAFIRLRYGPQGAATPQDLQELKHALRHFRP